METLETRKEIIFYLGFALFWAAGARFMRDSTGALFFVGGSVVVMFVCVFRQRLCRCGRKLRAALIVAILSLPLLPFGTEYVYGPKRTLFIAALWLLVAAGLLLFADSFMNNPMFMRKENSRVAKALFFIVPLPTLLVEWARCFPAKTSPDTIVQLDQIARGAYSDTHPFTHTLSMKLLMSVYDSLSSVIFFQIALLVIIFGCLCLYFYRRGVSGRILLPLLALSFCLPYVVDYSFYPWKDIPFSAAQLLITFELMILCDRGRLRTANSLLMGIGIAAVFLFRHNGILAAGFTIAVLLILAVKGNRSLLTGAAFALVLILLMKTAVYGHYDVAPNADGTKYAMLGKQICSVVYYDGHYDEAQKRQIEEIIMPVEMIKENYSWNHGESFLWYPISDAEGNYRFFGVTLGNRLPELLKLYAALLPRNLAIMAYDFLGSSSLMWRFDVNLAAANMSYLYILLIACVFVWRRNRFAVLPFAPALINVLSVIASNVSSETRYAYPTMLCFAPLLIYSYYILNKDQRVL
jgi:hypothetical protein